MQTKRVYVLVKAYPQPSQKHEETVCCAGLTEAGEFVRLYPIRYRRLKPEARFDRFDLIEIRGERPRDDSRPESFHVEEDSIRIVKRGKTLKSEQKAKLWIPTVSESLEALRDANKTKNVSLGIVRPDAGSVKFKWQKSDQDDVEDREIGAALLQQQVSFLEDPLKPLTPPEYSFSYLYTSSGLKSRGTIHDWEVQAAYVEYKQRYGPEALKVLGTEYGENIPARNLHFILGTMKAHPRTFIIIGLLRTTLDLDAMQAQHSLF